MSVPALDVERPQPNGTLPLLTPLSELMNEPRRARPHVVDRLLVVGGTSALVAKPKAGKGTCMRNELLAISRGEPFLGRRTVRGPVVYISLEDKRDAVAAHFRRMGASDEPIWVHAGAAPRNPKAFLESILEAHRPTLLGIDPIARFLKIRDFNDYAEVTEKTDPLIRLAAEWDTHIQFTHHAGKAERDGGDAFLGSTALFGCVDTAIVIRRDDQGRRTIETIQRYDDDLPPTLLSLDPSTGRLALGERKGAAELEDVRARLLDLLRERPLSEGAIRDQEKNRLVPKALRELLNEGKLTRSGKGRPGDPFIYATA